MTDIVNLRADFLWAACETTQDIYSGFKRRWNDRWCIFFQQEDEGHDAFYNYIGM